MHFLHDEEPPLLAFLNSFLDGTSTDARADRPLWHDLNDKSVITLGQLQREVVALRSKIGQSTAASWLLYSESPHYFLLGLLVLLGLKKKVIISASKKPEWLQGLRNEFDAILSDEILDQSPLVNFDLTLNTAGNWQPHYSGQEEIVFFTSGSTGQPKAVNKTLAALTNEIDTLTSTFSTVVAGGRFCASVSHQHIYGLLFTVLLPLAVGGSSSLQQIEYPEQLPLWLTAETATLPERKRIFISSPAFLGRLDLNLPHATMAAVFSSGGPLAFVAAQQARQHFRVLPIEVYGSTETGGIGYRQQTETSTPWTLFSGLTLGSSTQGVELSSPHMPGLGHCLLDDDLVLLPERHFLMKGRKDRVIKIAEKRVSLTEIENFLERQSTIARCVALPLLLKREVIACAIVLTPEGLRILGESGQSRLVSDWKQTMRNRFDNVTIPRKWQILTAIPLNSQSKTDTACLLAGFVADTK